MKQLAEMAFRRLVSFVLIVIFEQRFILFSFSLSLSSNSLTLGLGAHKSYSSDGGGSDNEGARCLRGSLYRLLGGGGGGRTERKQSGGKVM